MADTALTIITDALLDLGVLAEEEVPTAGQSSQALRKLNNLIDDWNIQNLLVYGATPYTLPTVGGKAVYTIGPGGDLNLPRPNDIFAVYVRDVTVPAANRFDYPLYVYNDQEWADVAIKGMSAQWPNYGIWFNYQYPLIQAYLNPIPTSSQFSIIIWIKGIITGLGLNDPISLAPGYKRALTANLAIELAASYEVQVPDTVVAIARNSINNLKTNNFQMNELQPAGVTGYDIQVNRYIVGR